MKCLSHLTSLFKACVPPAQEEIELHVRRLNVLLLTYQQVKTLTVAQWSATESEIEMELQWFDIHRLKLTSTSSPLLSTAVHAADAIGLKSQLTLTHSPSR
jgi:carbohydrate-binding DOMON domain-containing protein